MSGGSQHNPNGRQSQIGPRWSPLQLQMASYLSRAPQAHMASDRGVTWHTPTPPPHLYHVPVPSPPDPLQVLLLQAMKAGAGAAFRPRAPDRYRHTPTPPDKHLLSRHTPSPGDAKPGPPAEMYTHLAPGREKLRAEELVQYGGVDLSVSRVPPPAPPAHSPAPAPAPAAAPALGPAPAANGAPQSLSVRDAPTINSLIARTRRVDCLLERLAPSPHSVIVSRHAATPSPPSSNEDSHDSCAANKRKRKPERTVRLGPPVPAAAGPPPPPPPYENGADTNGPRPPDPADVAAAADLPPKMDEPLKRVSRSHSAETIDDIAAMIANDKPPTPKTPERPVEPETTTIDKLKSVLASPEPEKAEEKSEDASSGSSGPPEAAAPRRRSARLSHSDSTNVPVESPSEAKPAEPPEQIENSRTSEPTAASFVEVENQLEKMFAGIEESPAEAPVKPEVTKVQNEPKAKKRRKSTAKEKKEARSSTGAAAAAAAAATGAAGARGGRRGARGGRDAGDNDSGSNASSGKSRGPYIKVVGPHESPLSVRVMREARDTEREEEVERSRAAPRRRGLHVSTLGRRYDAATADGSWRCLLCARPPHHAGLGDLFGPYSEDTGDAAEEVWLHGDCAVWAPELLAGGARLWGLEAARTAARVPCIRCRRPGPLRCAARRCPAAACYPCARDHWRLQHDHLRAYCPQHAPHETDH